ncbi:hypothetical protein Droror1_Dr00027309 [Drosera rotundifolia]
MLRILLTGVMIFGSTFTETLSDDFSLESYVTNFPLLSTLGSSLWHAFQGLHDWNTFYHNRIFRQPQGITMLDELSLESYLMSSLNELMKRIPCSLLFEEIGSVK